MGTQSGMRVAFVITSLAPGADEPSKAWITWFASQGHDVTAIPLVDANPHALSPVTVRTEVARVSGRSRASALATLIARERFDAVISIRTGPNILSLTAAKRLSGTEHPLMVITEQSPLSLYLKEAPPSRRRAVKAARRLYRTADLAVSSSHPIAAELTAAFGVRASRSLIVPRPVLTDAAGRTPAPRSADAADRLQLVLTCPLTEAARPGLAVEAAHRLTADGVPTQVLSVTGGPLESDLKRQAALLGVEFVTRHGLDRSEWELSSAAVVVLPSRSEGLGDELIEAAAWGVPSAAISAALGVADAIIPGVTGELALDDDPASLAEAAQRASTLTVTDIDDWIDRFTPASSGALLERALQYAHALPSV